MRKRYDLATLDWTLSGWTPHLWRLERSMETGTLTGAEVAPLPAAVPGSVQGALRAVGVIPDWNVGLNARACEWVENRHWLYEAHLPDTWLAEGTTLRLVCLGLDYRGWIVLNGREIAAFTGSFHPHDVDLTPHLRPTGNVLHIAFDCPPRWLGQFGYTSRMRAWKPRFNYGWDWTSRLVQLGIWDDLFLEVTDGHELAGLRFTTDVALERGTGMLSVAGVVHGDAGRGVRLTLERDGERIRVEEAPVAAFAAGVTWDGLPVELWWPHGEGPQPLYTLRCELLDGAGHTLDADERRVGFKRVTWAACAGAPDGADPWICVLNGRPTFLQGVNWTPIRPNFADVTDAEYRQRLELYRDLGCNVLRVWGGAYLEKRVFYDLCDELGLLVWQEFPLSSSGVDNWPPEDEQSIEEMAAIAGSYVARRQHHVSLFLWSGGNELQGALDGGKVGTGKPVDSSHPMIARLQQIVGERDPTRRFVPTSSSGPRFYAEEEDFGQGLHWDVHGPWQVPADFQAWERYWAHDDALFRSETGAPGASAADVIRAFRGEYAEIPGTAENPLWNRTAWWIEWPAFVEEHGREPRDLEEYVAWSQGRQARALSIAARACKGRFPRCGGFIVWMGHDSFPCTANTAIVDYHGRPKPAALALRDIFNGR